MASQSDERHGPRELPSRRDTPKGQFTATWSGGASAECCDACTSLKTTDGSYLTSLCTLHAAAPEMLALLRLIADDGIAYPHVMDRVRALLARVQP